jgi:hypothetical protein
MKWRCPRSRGGTRAALRHLTMLGSDSATIVFSRHAMYLTQLNPGTGALRLPSATHRAFTSFGFARSNTDAVAITFIVRRGFARVELQFDAFAGAAERAERQIPRPTAG